jgi:hypothetical protein
VRYIRREVTAVLAGKNKQASDLLAHGKASVDDNFVATPDP